MKTFKLTISTPIGKNFEVENVTMLNARVLEGQIGILANHAPLISSLKISEFQIIMEDGLEKIGVVHGGIFSVKNNEVSILTTEYHFDDEIDIEKTQKELEEIEEQFQDDVKPSEQTSLNNRHIYAELKLKIAK
ncbi:MAG: ATP synthase epsilon chain [Candidatus Tyloplasma litorale]|nr:MAG: ATP synthase epsilon chain [Mycoplasmatales bacterium]